MTLGARWDEAIPSFPLELEKAGYFIGHTYKVGAVSDRCHPSEPSERAAKHRAHLLIGHWFY